MFPVLTNKACIGWLWCHVSEVTFISALMLICSIYLMEHYLWVHCMYAWICSLCRSYDSVSAWRCSRTRQHRECFTESASAFAVRAVKAWCALVTVCVQTECQPGEASVMSPALAHFTVCVCASSATAARLTCVQWYAGLTCGTRAASSNTNSPASLLWSQLQLFEPAVVKLFVSSPSQSIYTTVLLCPSLCVGRHEKLCVLGYVRLCLTARIRSTAQPQCSLLRFDRNKFSIHNKVIKRSNLKSKLILVRCTLYVSFPIKWVNNGK